MKPIIKLCIFLIFLSGTSIYSQYGWTNLIYHYQTGSVPPPHFYQYDLSIHTDGTPTLVYFPGYSNDTTWVYNFNISEDGIKTLNDSITSSKILSEPLTSLPEHKHPIGGSMQNIRIFLPQEPGVDRLPQSVVSPFFPLPQFADGLNNLYETTRSLIPQNTWDEIAKRKEEYKTKYNK